MKNEPAHVSLTDGSLLSRRSLLAGGLSVAFVSNLSPEADAEVGKGLLIGLCPPTYYNGFSPFLNWWKQGAPFQMQTRDGRTLSGRQIWDEGIYLDAETGELKASGASAVRSLSRLFFASPSAFQQDVGCDYSGEEFSIEWDGRADVRVDFLTSGATQKTIGSNQIIFSLGANPGNTAVTFTITDADSPPTNIRIYQTRYARNVANGETFNPDWIEVVSKFDAVRCMDWLSVNNSTISEMSQLADLDYCSWGQLFQSTSANDEQGPKGSVHPRLLCELANSARVGLHVCIPHRATDAFVESFARYFRDNSDAEVTFEFSNECWNYGFSQTRDMNDRAKSLWPDDPAQGHKYYGYRSAECMNIISGVYGGKKKWRGALATQTVNPNVTRAILTGVELWISRNASRSSNLSISSLFDSLYVTGYFGDVTGCTQPTIVTRSSPAIVTSVGHGYDTGHRVRFFVSSGMTQLNERDVVVTRIDENSYAIDLDTSEFEDYDSSSKNYVAPSILFQLMDSSESKHRANPVEFPEPYTFFNQQVSQSLLNGECDSGFLVQVSVAALRDKFWPEQLAIAKSKQLTLRQYEGGCHLVGDAYLSGFGGNARYTDYLLHHSHCREIATVYKSMYESFVKIGGQYPCKYLMEGTVSQFGSWAGIRYWPTAANNGSSDVGNPVWLTTLAANARS